MRQFIYTPRSGDRVFAMVNNCRDLDITQLGNKSWVVETSGSGWTVVKYQTANRGNWYRASAIEALRAVARGGTVDLVAWDENGDINVLVHASDARRIHHVVCVAAHTAGVQKPDIPVSLIATPVVGVVGWDEDRPVVGWVSDTEFDRVRSEYLERLLDREIETAYDAGFAARAAENWNEAVNAAQRIEYLVDGGAVENTNERHTRRLASAKAWLAEAAEALATAKQDAAEEVVGTVIAIE